MQDDTVLIKEVILLIKGSVVLTQELTVVLLEIAKMQLDMHSN